MVGLVVVRPGEKRQRRRKPLQQIQAGWTRGGNSRCQQLWRKRHLHQACKTVWRHRKGQYFTDHLPWGPVLYQVTGQTLRACWRGSYWGRRNSRTCAVPVTDPQIKIARTTFSCTQVCLFVVVCWRSLAGMTKTYRTGTEERFGQLGLCALMRERLMGSVRAVCKFNMSEN